VFLYRYQTSLVGAEYIARLLGYAADPVVAALDVLDSLGLVARSRVSQNVRLYQFTTPPEPPRHEAFERLMALTHHRVGRLLLSRQLRRENSNSQGGLGATWLFPEEADPGNGSPEPSRQHAEGRQIWLKAI